MYMNQPPRTHFWAEDLCIRHEQFHANENVSFGQQGTTTAQNWMSRQTAQSYDDVRDLFAPAIQKVASFVTGKMAPPAVERRAYSAGAADYKTRADAIKAKGDAGGYAPKPPTAPPATAPPATTPPPATQKEPSRHP
jgi:hypothetical protein